jgi:hypothetical protein
MTRNERKERTHILDGDRYTMQWPRELFRLGKFGVQLACFFSSFLEEN